MPFHNVCAAQSPVGDRMSRLEKRLNSLCNQFQKHNTDGKKIIAVLCNPVIHVRVEGTFTGL